MNNEKQRKLDDIAFKRDQQSLEKYGVTYSMIEKTDADFFHCPICMGSKVVRHEEFNPRTTQYNDWESKCEECNGSGQFTKEELLEKLA